MDSPTSPQPFDGIVPFMSSLKQLFGCVGIRSTNLFLDNPVALFSKLFLRLGVAHCDDCASHLIIDSTRKPRCERDEQDCVWKRVTTFDS
jgi:hypothetical protein